MSDKLRAEVTFECEQLDLLLQKFSGLLTRLRSSAPDEVEIAAIGTLLHSF